MTDLSIDLVEYLGKLSMESDADLLRESLKMEWCNIVSVN